MAYSTIERKKCKCSPICDKWPTLSCYGYNYAHLPENLKEKAGTKRRVAQKNKNIRNSIMLKARKEDRLVNGASEQELWYLLRRYEMTGVCQEQGCGCSTNKDNDTYFKWSVCHIVPKKLVPSVATHIDNWIELCWTHHSEYDSTFDKAKNMKCFPEAKRKFDGFKELIPNEEMRKINPCLLERLPLSNPNEQILKS